MNKNAQCDRDFLFLARGGRGLILSAQRKDGDIKLDSSPNLVVWTVREDWDLPVVTVELRGKWYHLLVVYPDLTWAAYSFEGPREHGTVVDHVPSPAAVEKWAQAHGWEVDDLALEILVGRWVLEQDSATAARLGLD